MSRLFVTACVEQTAVLFDEIMPEWWTELDEDMVERCCNEGFDVPTLPINLFNDSFEDKIKEWLEYSIRGQGPPPHRDTPFVRVVDFALMGDYQMLAKGQGDCMRNTEVHAWINEAWLAQINRRREAWLL